MHSVTAAPIISIDTALSETARDLRSQVREAVDPPGTSRYVRRAQLKQALRDDVARFIFAKGKSRDVARVLASAVWAIAFIDMALSQTSEPEIAVDDDGEVLFEWLNGPREVLTISVGPDGVLNFASLAGPSRFHGVARIGDRLSAPLVTCLAPFKVASPA